jgi:hypothetical protein
MNAIVLTVIDVFQSEDGRGSVVIEIMGAAWKMRTRETPSHCAPLRALKS